MKEPLEKVAMMPNDNCNYEPNMNGGNGNGNGNGNVPFKNQLARWLFTQGASTVLLFGILCAISYGAYTAVPALIIKQAEELKETRDDFRAALKEQRQDFLDTLRRLENVQK